MLPIYIACAIAGGGLILLSALGGIFGSHDIDHSADAEVGLDVSHDGPDGVHDLAMDHATDTHGSMSDVLAKVGGKGLETAGSSGFWLPFLSIRFWTYFVGGFGILGTVLSLFGIESEPMRLYASLGTGVFLGLVAAYVWRFIQKDQLDASTKEGDFIGAMGTMTVSSRNHEPGKVRVSVRGELIDLIARTTDDQDVSAGEEVVVVEIDGGLARVMKKSELLK